MEELGGDETWGCQRGGVRGGGSEGTGAPDLGEHGDGGPHCQRGEGLAEGLHCRGIWTGFRSSAAVRKSRLQLAGCCSRFAFLAR